MSVGVERKAPAAGSCGLNQYVKQPESIAPARAGRSAREGAAIRRAALARRQPLCGIGVTSRMDVTVKPAACSARRADSRPEPGPQTSTSTMRMPSRGLAGGILGGDLRGIRGGLPRTLEAHQPDDDQEMVLPCASVMVIIVLLNDAFT